MLQPHLCDIHSPFICEMIEHIVSVNSSSTCLLVAKYEVNPLVQVPGHMWRLQGGTVFGQQLRGARCPGGKLNVVHRATILAYAKGKLRAVYKEVTSCKTLEVLLCMRDRNINALHMVSQLSAPGS